MLSTPKKRFNETLKGVHGVQMRNQHDAWALRTRWDSHTQAVGVAVTGEAVGEEAGLLSLLLG